MEKPARTKLFLHLKKWLEKAVIDYGMIEEGDRVLVGVSGGADSMVLLDLLNTPMLFVPSFPWRPCISIWVSIHPINATMP